MKDQIEYVEMKNFLYGLAEEINSMTEEEKLISLKKIVQAELGGNKNLFWTTLSKKMLVSSELPNKILMDKELTF
jgi:hypothetical protein